MISSFLVIVVSCSSSKSLKTYKIQIQECIEEKVISRGDQFGYVYYSKEQGGLIRVLQEFEEALLKQGKLEEGSEKGYRKLINNLPLVAFDSILQRQKLNAISENDGLFNAEYTDTCPASVLTEEILDKKVIAYKLQLEKLTAKGGVPDKKYLEEFIHFIDFDVHSDRLFFTYLIFLHLKYS
ncbi:hypothetical protein [uncultured Dokdonia sp.]|uniref:hypothetical protein n=1 Tax=uncultured Dokdonia sp. TaxID=575653 RepID=UPI00261324B0|nr:hypothetical protein [uncultured Dokdonia sp.]